MTWRAPGRVNLIGEHTDYNLGFVLPVALEMSCMVTSSPSQDGALRARSQELGQQRSWRLEEIPGVQPAGDWGDYIAGVALELHRAGYATPAVDLEIHSSVPVGAGLSSSAALEVSTALALLGGREAGRAELARICHRAETGFVGLPCGIMDQYISIFGQENAALEIDCRSLEHRAVTLPGGVWVAAVNTMVRHELGQSAYRQRVAECAQAVEAIRGRHPEVASLRDASPDHLRLVEGTPMRRARHVITENRRVTAFVEACRKGDRAGLGRLFVASHRSLQHDYEVSCEELDFLVDTAVSVRGVFGARMTGGGFGGCTVNLLAPEVISEFTETVTKAYKDRFGIEPQVYPCRPSAGAGLVAADAEIY